MIAYARGMMTVSTEGARRDQALGLARSLTALRLGLELLGEAVSAGDPPGPDTRAIAEALQAVVRRAVNAAGTLFVEPAAA